MSSFTVSLLGIEPEGANGDLRPNALGVRLCHAQGHIVHPGLARGELDLIVSGLLATLVTHRRIIWATAVIERPDKVGFAAYRVLRGQQQLDALLRGRGRACDRHLRRRRHNTRQVDAVHVTSRHLVQVNREQVRVAALNADNNITNPRGRLELGKGQRVRLRSRVVLAPRASPQHVIT